MSRNVKRLLLVFLAVVVGLAACGYAGLALAVQQVRSQSTEPVRRQVDADWRANAASLEADLAKAAAWTRGDGPSPVELGCRLRWTPADRDSVKKHAARCGGKTYAVSPEVLDALSKLGAEVLKREAEAPPLPAPLDWLAELRATGRWSFDTGTPWELEATDPWQNPTLAWPLLDLRHVRAVGTLRLLEGVRAGKLEDAVVDVEAFARALASSPHLLSQLGAFAVLKATRDQLDALGRPELGPRADEVEALKRSRRALAMLWNPWVPKEVRDAVDAKAPPEARCAAAWESTIFLGEVSLLMRDAYPQFYADFEAKQATPGWCDSTQLALVWKAARTVPPDAWSRLSAAGTISGSGTEAAGPALLVTLARVSPSARRAAADVLLAIATPNPFPGSDAGVAP